MSTERFALMRLDPAWLTAVGLPVREYPIAIDAFKDVVASGGQILPEFLLLWLQLYAEHSAEWQQLEPAMRALIERLAPSDDRAEVSVAGDTWRLISGPLDLGAELVTVQRGETLLAAVERHPDGGLRAACYRPLDAKAIRYLFGLARNPAPDGTVCMRADNFEYAKDASAGTGNWYAFERGESHLSYWEHGIGLSRDREPVEPWSRYRTLEPLRPTQLGIQLGIHCQLADDLP